MIFNTFLGFTVYLDSHCIDFFFSLTGNVSQWGEVKKTTDRTRPKPKEAQNTQTESTPVSVRGGRGRGGFEGRGRARGDRGRGGRGGRRVDVGQ